MIVMMKSMTGTLFNHVVRLRTETGKERRSSNMFLSLLELISALSEPFPRNGVKRDARTEPYVRNKRSIRRRSA